MTVFAAIDFETADYWRDSACAVGIVLVENGRIAQRYEQLIRPPREEFVFTHIHGLTWNDVRDSPTFGEVWPEMRDIIGESEFLVAHNASFDKSVLRACCQADQIEPPEQEIRCTMQMARAKWDLPSAKLAIVCEHLRIPLNHHNALSDAEACAKIAIEAFK
ncbi:MAG: 3'-5' exonuclease [Gammaproteobacteria bacterium]|nr:3'-5' exonuclease [Gammaproteobacteria bacterium]MDE0365199.1 3'-5' exonuclease [Gammaproteobacteria bacterium]